MPPKSAFGPVKSARVASGDSPDQTVATGTNVVVRGITSLAGATAGTIELRGGGSGGSADHTFDTSSNSNLEATIIPAGGLPPLDGLHVTLDQADAVVVFYEEVP